MDQGGQFQLTGGDLHSIGALVVIIADIHTEHRIKGIKKLVM